MSKPWEREGDLKLAAHCSNTEHTAVLGLCSTCCNRDRAEEGRRKGSCAGMAEGRAGVCSLPLEVSGPDPSASYSSHFQDCCRQKWQQVGNVLLFQEDSPLRQILDLS